MSKHSSYAWFLGRGFCSHPKPWGRRAAPFPKGEQTVKIARPVHPFGRAIHNKGAVNALHIMGGRKAVGQGCHDLVVAMRVAFHQDISGIKAVGLGGVEQCTLTTFDIANHNTAVAQADVKIGVGDLAANLNPICHTVQTRKITAFLTRMCVGIAGPNRCVMQATRKADGIVTFGAANIDNQVGGAGDNRVDYRGECCLVIPINRGAPPPSDAGTP